MTVGAVSGLTFPEAIGKGSTVGVAHGTKITSQMRGEESRWVRRGQAQRKWTVSRVGGKADLEDVRDFVSRHGGARDGFYFVDPLDKSTASDHVSAPSVTDEWIGVGDGTTTTFTLLKRYEKGTQYERSRRCYGIQNGGIALNNGTGAVTQIPGVDYTVETTLGTVTFTVAPPAGHEITGGWTYRNFARFDVSTDEELGEVYSGFEAGEVHVGIVEDKLAVSVPDRMKFGTARAVLTPKANELLHPELGSFVFYVPTSPMTLYLPDIRGEEGQVVPSYARTMVRGGPYFTVYNASTTGGATITLKEVYQDSTPKAAYRTLTTDAVLNPGEARTLYVSDAASTDTDAYAGQVWVSS